MVIAAALVMLMGVGLPAVANAMPTNAHPASAVTAATAQTPAAAATPAGGSSATQGPHPGLLDVYEAVPGGATTEDPAIAYDVNSAEILLNTYEELVSYNGTSTASMVPYAATCVPGQGNQCDHDYGGNFTGIYTENGTAYTGAAGQEPYYWSFAIDPAAHFYDPSTKKSWSVYPTDVMASIARTLAWADFSKDPGWIIAQSLLQIGNSSWDSGAHFPFNNTPENIYASMLINSTQFCPAKAMGALGHGCITFVANGEHQAWPSFLQFVEDPSGASIMPCGWLQYIGAYPGASYAGDGYPEPASVGWGPSSQDNKLKGDDSCLLPDGANNTNTAAWAHYLGGSGPLNPESWDNYEAVVTVDWPAPTTALLNEIVGSGPYYAFIDYSQYYYLYQNPAYIQPSACGGNPAFAQYTGYCAPSQKGKAYIHTVFVEWESAEVGDTDGTNAILAGTADFAGFETEDLGDMLADVAAGLWQYFFAPSLSTGFLPVNFFTDYEKANSSSLPMPPSADQLLPEPAASDLGFRNFLAQSFPYQTFQSTMNEVYNLDLATMRGGPIPYGMGAYGNSGQAAAGYYPLNITYALNYGDPTQSSSVVGSAAWWWNALTTVSGPYYDAGLASCTSSTPCYMPIGYFDGEPQYANELGYWQSYVSSITGGAVVLFPSALTFNQFLASFGAPYTTPQIGAIGFGWSPDYPDPTDYIAPMAAPDGDYTGADAVAEQMALPQYNLASCPDNISNAVTQAQALSDLDFWANQSTNYSLGAGSAFTSGCEGTAYATAAYWMTVAAGSSPNPPGGPRFTEYNLIEQIINRMALDIYQGQTNYMFGSAPWINEASINQNPVIGAGEMALWYQIGYKSGLAPVTVSEKGLPTGTTWHFTINGETHANTTATVKGKAVGTMTFYENANASLLLDATQSYAGVKNATLAGYSPVAVTGPKGTTWTAATVVGIKALALGLTFGANETLTFSEVTSKKATGLREGTLWSVTLTATTTGSNPTPITVGNTTTAGGGSVVFVNVPAGLKFHYTVSYPTLLYTGPSKGGNVGVSTNPAKNLVKLTFNLITKKVKFSETGLLKGTTWGFNLTGPWGGLGSNNTTVHFGPFSPGKSDTLALDLGEFSVTYWNVTGYHLTTPPTSPFTVPATTTVVGAYTKA